LEQLFIDCIGFCCLRFAFCFGFRGVCVVPVHVVKRKGRLKPATTTQFFDRHRLCCKNLSIVLEFAGSSSLYDAHHYMSRERAGHTLQTTAILNEAYLRLVDDTKPVWQGRTHFIAAAAQLMRRIMVDDARERRSLKRGGGARKVTLDEAALVTETRSEELLALDEALEGLAVQDTRKSQIVELRYFGGLTVEETAEFLKLSRRTVEREWTMAKAWLYLALSEEET
jgi:RNA polymerase sigma-70 factor (ECF subfamily)